MKTSNIKKKQQGCLYIVARWAGHGIPPQLSDFPSISNDSSAATKPLVFPLTMFSVFYQPFFLYFVRISIKSASCIYIDHARCSFIKNASYISIDQASCICNLHTSGISNDHAFIEHANCIVSTIYIVFPLGQLSCIFLPL